MTQPLRLITIVAVATLVAACSSDPADNNDIVDAGTSGDSGATVDAGSTADDSVPEGDTSVGQDTGGSDCIQATATIDTLGVSSDTDVSIEYAVELSPDINGETRPLRILFERYNNAEYTGTFELGTGADENFGTCAHCVHVWGDSAERAWFADSGTLTIDRLPFGRRADMRLEGLRLIEVAVNPADRSSAPLADGSCIEIADVDVEGVFPPGGWLCPDEQYNDRTACHCNCGAVDPDCGGAIGCLPGDPTCEPRDELPVENCTGDQVCAFEPVGMTNACIEACDWAAADGCTTGVCVFDSGGGDGDLCIPEGPRVLNDVGLGDACPSQGLQGVCNVVDGFAQGYCGPNNICRPICDDDAECPVEGETCRAFTTQDPLGYCGPEPVDG